MNTATIVQKLWNYCNILGAKPGTEHVFREQVAEQVPESGQAAAAGRRSHRQGRMGVDEIDVKGDTYEGCPEKGETGLATIFNCMEA